eukprot:6748381-Alexandrium_andersonii.AAC.1
MPVSTQSIGAKSAAVVEEKIHGSLRGARSASSGTSTKEEQYRNHEWLALLARAANTVGGRSEDERATATSFLSKGLQLMNYTAWFNT